MRIGIAKKGGSSTIVTPNSSIVTWTGSQTWQAHNAMGASGVVDGPGLFSGNVISPLNIKETLSSDPGASSAAGLTVNYLLDVNVNTNVFMQAFAPGIRTVTTNTRNYGVIVGIESFAWHQGSGTVNRLIGQDTDVSTAGGAVAQAIGFRANVYNTGASLIDAIYGFAVYDLANYGAGIVTNAYGYYIDTPGTSTTVTNNYAYYSNNLVATATNPYFLWYNGTGANAGVWRVNHLGIVAYYNPTFADYTPGAANYERIVTQWTSDVAEIGTEAGGTGTKRVTRILGTGVELQIYSRVAAVAVASLPAAAAGLAGARATVNDSNAALTAGIGAIVAAGGANVVPVFCDGTNWRIG